MTTQDGSTWTRNLSKKLQNLRPEKKYTNFTANRIAISDTISSTSTIRRIDKGKIREALIRKNKMTMLQGVRISGSTGKENTIL